MAKIETKSLQVKNMNDHNYMIVHKRMYALSSSDSFFICLINDNDIEVSVEVSDHVFKSFVNYELSFGVMFMVYTSLCVKYGQIQIPF